MKVTMHTMAQLLESVGYEVEKRDDAYAYEKHINQSYCFGHLHDTFLSYYSECVHLTIRYEDITSVSITDSELVVNLGTSAFSRIRFN